MPGLFSEYCGPNLWIWEGTGIPRHVIDEICKKHDDAYEAYKEKYGYYPYANFIEADQEFLNDVKKHWKEKPIVAGPAVVWFEGKKVTNVAWNEFRNRVSAHFEAVDDQIQNAMLKVEGLARKPYEIFKKIMTRTGEKDASVYNMPTGKRMKTEDDELGFPDWARSPRERERKTPVQNMEVDASGETSAESRPSSPIVAGDHNAVVPQHFDWQGVTSRSAMSNTGDVPMANARTAVSTGTQVSGGANGTGETTVDLGNPYERGFFTETRTALLPTTAYFSFHNMDKNSPVVLKIACNSPYHIFRDNTIVGQEQGAANNKGLGNTIPQANSNFNYATTLQRFPTLIQTNTPATVNAGNLITSGNGTIPVRAHLPSWLTYYERVYESYHTIETFYRITFETVGGNPNRQITIFETEDVYTGSSTGNIIPTNQPYSFYQQYKNVKTHSLKYRDNNTLGPHRRIIEGVWKPGNWNRNTTNDEDIKAWYPTQAAPSNPQWVEQKVLMGFLSEFSETNAQTNCVIRVDLVYKVQFKDLRLPYRYPTTNVDTVAAFSNDALQQGTPAPGPAPNV